MKEEKEAPSVRGKQVRTLWGGPQVKYTVPPSRHRQGGWEGAGSWASTGIHTHHVITKPLKIKGQLNSHRLPWAQSQVLIWKVETWGSPQASVCFPDCIGS